ncbi:PilZ domain-containing protein [Spartinivicinus ruber]|uniref:PilZ domain-containing protein n=1 Tax=Spartinivicinus ruber TaxID=2683272 RepID=UPI0013D2444A|nr:PilZ domain-containing protein [Spartinivicinus ruber]
MANHSFTNEKRLIPRHHLTDYLTVYNNYTDRSMGFIGNISTHGLMLISEIPIMTSAEYQLLIKLPDNAGKIDFIAVCLWCKPDIDQRYFDSGFEIIHTHCGIKDIVESLQHYFSFKD